MIDLHMHTTASDGTCTPDQLVRLAVDAGLTVIGVADHDTMNAVPAVTVAAARHGIEVVPGIEITSVLDGRDVHVLGYFVDVDCPELQALLLRHRQERVGRAREIGERLARCGVPIDVDALLAAAPPNAGKALARPQIARALIEHQHVATVAEAFDRFLGESCPAYVPHTGATPHEVIGLIARSGGISSLAHPGTTNRDDQIPSLRDAGLEAIEAHHSAHTPELTARYLDQAREFDLAVTGGSDSHGPATRRSEWFGKIHLPESDYQEFRRRAARTERYPPSSVAVGAGPAT
jgi:predicted metal-dependent phosphoesterase TrpH